MCLFNPEIFHFLLAAYDLGMTDGDFAFLALDAFEGEPLPAYKMQI